MIIMFNNIVNRGRLDSPLNAKIFKIEPILKNSHLKLRVGAQAGI